MTTANPAAKPKIDFAVGGQAVIEGVMMRSPNHVTVAVRRSDGIKVKDQPFKSIALKIKLFGIPFVRGVVNLFEMMMVGMRMLNYSALEQIDDEETKEAKEKGIEKTTANLAEAKPETTGEKVSAALAFGFSIIFALGMSLFLFKFLPLWITDYLSQQYPILNEKYVYFNLIDGGLKTVFFITYIGLLGLTPSLRRVFQYHGAEHKSIFTYERGFDLTVDNAMKQERFHPRCGTSFILVVFLISIAVYTMVPRQPDFVSNFALRVVFLPLIAGISYEFLKWSAKKQNSLLVRAMTAPGLMFQRLTTKEPTGDQLEVALEALKKALELEELPQTQGELRPQLDVA